MNISPAPLPTLLTLVRALKTNPSSGRVWSGQAKDVISFYSRARWGLADAIKISLSNSRDGLIWLPEYFCEEAMGPLREIPAKIRFYPVQEDLQPDWDRMSSMGIKGTGSAVLILVHYFGFPNNIDKAGQFCREQGIDLIEDAAHVLSPGPGGIGAAGAFAVYSPRKLLSVPDVGVLVIRGQHRLPHNFSIPSNSHKGIATWVMKRIILILLFHFGISRYRVNLPQSGAINEKDNADEVGKYRTGCSPYSGKLLGMSEKYFTDITGLRRNNYRNLLNGIKDLKDVELLFPFLPEGVCPYLFSLRVQKDRNRLIEVLRGVGIPAGTWPTLPREVINDNSLSMASRLQKEILTLPVHQSLKEKDIAYMADAVNRALHRIN